MLLYGRGTASVAEQIGVSIQEAQELVDKFFNGFPKVKKWIEQVQSFAHENGYVEGIVGRRRRLPDIQLPKYSITPDDEYLNNTSSFNPFLGTEEISKQRNNIYVEKYNKLLESVRSRKDIDNIKQQALQEHVTIQDNTGFIAKAERQSVNALVQGGAATITKIAMINVDKDPELNRLGFKMLICVHDEIIGECPRENAHAVSERLSQVMIESAATVCSVPMKCDCYEVSRWYEDDFSDSIHGKYEELLKDGKDPVEARNELLNRYPMIQTDRLVEMIEGTYECNKYEDI